MTTKEIAELRQLCKDEVDHDFVTALKKISATGGREIDPYMYMAVAPEFELAWREYIKEGVAQ
jgi:hypothetical protein